MKNKELERSPSKGQGLTPPVELLDFLRVSKNLVLATHINPEGDALGSTIALGIALARLGKNIALYNRDRVPSFYKYLPGSESFSNSDFKKLIKEFMDSKGQIDGIVLLDCNTPERAEIEKPEDVPLVIIDHHETERDISAIKWILPQAPATGLMVYYLIKALEVTINYEMAVNLYTAIAIDTGTFRYGNTTPEALEVGSELIALGVKPELISEALYGSWTVNRFNLFRECLNSLEIIDGIAFSYVTEEMVRTTGSSPEDTENFSNFPLTIKDVKVSLLLRQIGPDKWKASLRSKGNIDVANIASSFGGGGHRNAAGAFIDGRLEEIKRSIIGVVKRFIGEGVKG